MKTLHLNDNLIRILTSAAANNFNTAKGLENDEHFSMQDGVGHIVRTAAEQAYQDIAVLKDIVTRYKDSK